MNVMDPSELSPEQWLPHTQPMILIRKIKEIEASKIVCMANFTNDGYFQSNSGVPVSWSVEIISQACALFISIRSVGKSLSMGRLMRCKYLNFHTDYLPYEADLSVESVMTMAGSNGVSMFNGSIKTSSGDVLVEGAFSVFAQ
jgi:predicted hotdog family 3-hydroxylacyl-ACP dehydratase